MSTAPMSIKNRLSEQIKVAMKTHQKDVLVYARSLHAAIRKKEIDTRTDLNDDGVLLIIQSLVKQRQDSIEQFKTGGREDLVTREEAELGFLKTFMPPPMDKNELSQLVDWAIQEVKASTLKDMGSVMKLLMPRVLGRADGKQINQLIKEKLQS